MTSLEGLRQEEAPRMPCWSEAAASLVVVDNLDLFGPGVRPEETDSVLIVDSDAVLSGSIPGKGFQAVSRRRAKIAQLRGRIELIELSPGDSPNGLGTYPARRTRSLAVEDILRASIPE